LPARGILKAGSSKGKGEKEDVLLLGLQLQISQEPTQDGKGIVPKRKPWKK